MFLRINALVCSALCILCLFKGENKEELIVYHNSVLVPEQWREVHTLLFLNEETLSYEIMEINSPKVFRFFDRKELGTWKRSNDTLFLFPQWELSFRYDSSFVMKNLLLEENRTVFNQRKKALFVPGGLIGLNDVSTESEDLFSYREPFIMGKDTLYLLQRIPLYAK